MLLHFTQNKYEILYKFLLIRYKIFIFIVLLLLLLLFNVLFSRVTIVLLQLGQFGHCVGQVGQGIHTSGLVVVVLTYPKISKITCFRGDK